MAITEAEPRTGRVCLSCGCGGSIETPKTALFAAVTDATVSEWRDRHAYCEDDPTEETPRG